MEGPRDRREAAYAFHRARRFTQGAAKRAAQGSRLAANPDAPRVHRSRTSANAARPVMFSHRPRHDWAQRSPDSASRGDDLVLPKDTPRWPFARSVRFRALSARFLLEDWGFAAKLPYGPRACPRSWPGHPGTGPRRWSRRSWPRSSATTSYRIDFCRSSSTKYIGETEEESWRKIFDEAETSHAVAVLRRGPNSLFREAHRREVVQRSLREPRGQLPCLQRMGGRSTVVTLLREPTSRQGLGRTRSSVSVRFLDPVRASPRKPKRRRFVGQACSHPRCRSAPDIDWDLIAKAVRSDGRAGYIKKAALRGRV